MLEQQLTLGWGLVLLAVFAVFSYLRDLNEPNGAKKSFAAAINRDDIVRGAEDLGVELNQHIQFVIDAMEEARDKLGLTGQAN